jgi:hypothetical protein
VDAIVRDVAAALRREPALTGKGGALWRNALSSPRMNSRAVLLLAVVVAAVVGGVMFFLQDKPVPTPVALTPSAQPVDPGVVTPEQTPRIRVAEKSPVEEKLPPPLPGATPISDADRKIDEILRINPENTEAAHISTAQMLINLIPTLPPEGQAEAAQHVSNLLPDKEYQRVRTMVVNPNAAPELLDVLVTDLMNRDDGVKLPVLLDIAKIPNHPTREEATTDLQIFLDGDYGTDWAKWDAALKAYLKKQAEETPPRPDVIQ